MTVEFAPPPMYFQGPYTQLQPDRVQKRALTRKVPVVGWLLVQYPQAVWRSADIPVEHEAACAGAANTTRVPVMVKAAAAAEASLARRRMEGCFTDVPFLERSDS
ncbi:hypothetical protein ACQP1V_17305 [Microtetraspora malaysiensis]|uniref:hypothetical protein n=1 Tax=Microtetraspora malaysiensis TaxID=161358 RepID=UPI003D8A52F6